MINSFISAFREIFWKLVPPYPLKLNLEFQPKIDCFIQRHAVKPGITGLAQANVFRGETVAFSDMSGRVRLDRFYVKNWSLVLDHHFDYSIDHPRE